MTPIRAVKVDISGSHFQGPVRGNVLVGHVPQVLGVREAPTSYLDSGIAK